MFIGWLAPALVQVRALIWVLPAEKRDRLWGALTGSSRGSTTMVRKAVSLICILIRPPFDPVVLNKRLAKGRVSEALQLHLGDPADKEGRNQALL